MGSWPSTKVGDVAAPGGLVGGPFGSNLGSRDYVESGVPVIRGRNLTKGRWVDLSDSVYVTPEKMAKDLNRNTAEAGDVVYTQRGTLGQVAMMPEGSPTAVISQSQMRLRVDPSKADPQFVYYWATSPQFLALLSDRAIIAGVPHINLGILAQMPLPQAPLDEQRRIAGVLGALDDLIEADHALASCLEAVWRNLVTVAARNSSVRVPLSSLASFVNGKNFTKGAIGYGRPVIRTPEVRNGPTASTVRSDASAASDNIATVGDVLFVWSGSLCVARWAWEPGLVNQHVFKVSPTGSTPPWLVIWAIESLMPDFLGVAADKATTMGHIKRADLDRLVSVPDPATWKELDSKVTAAYDAALDLRSEADEVGRTRDELLPLLTSGKIRVSKTLEVP